MSLLTATNVRLGWVGLWVSNSDMFFLVPQIAVGKTSGTANKIAEQKVAQQIILHTSVSYDSEVCPKLHNKGTQHTNGWNEVDVPHPNDRLGSAGGRGGSLIYSLFI